MCLSYVFQRTGSDIQTVVQLIRPENKRVFLSTAASYTRTMQAAVKGGSAVVGRRRSSLLRGSSDNGTTNLVVCLEELRSNLLSLSCLCPGLCTLVYNLVASVSGADEVKDRKRAWLQEYHSGMEYEIYRVPLSVHFEGVTFLQVCYCGPSTLILLLTVCCPSPLVLYDTVALQAAEIVYSEVGCILFALEVKVPGMESRVLLNPGSWELPDPLIYHLHGFVIAEDKKQVSSLGRLCFLCLLLQHPPSLLCSSPPSPLPPGGCRFLHDIQAPQAQASEDRTEGRGNRRPRC